MLVLMKENICSYSERSDWYQILNESNKNSHY